MKDIVEKIKEANLIGRGGACFPTALKWEAVNNTKADKKYVICNCSEGEPGVKKDGYILKKYPEKVIDGMKIAIDFLTDKDMDVEAYFYINSDYHKWLKKDFKKLVGSDYKIHLFKKPHGAGYIGGEEGSVINAIEGKRVEPRLRPPFPTTNGLWNKPTMVNNVETFYNVSLVKSNEFKNERFYTISGEAKKKGVFKMSADWTIEKVLRETGNWPKFKFFVQVGGDGSGEVLNQTQLKKPASGAGSIRIYNLKKIKPEELIKSWMKFFKTESCGQCTPCREGTYKILEIAKSKNPDWKVIGEILDVIDDTAFCGLGCVVSIPIRSYIKNVLNNNKISLNSKSNKSICECFG